MIPKYSSDGGNSGTIRLGSDGTYYGQQQFRYNSSEYRFGVYPSGNMTFYTKGSESMRIDSSGRVFFAGATTLAQIEGGTKDAALITGAGTWESGKTTTGAANHLEFFNPNGNVGKIQTSGSSTTYSTSSDYRLKENIAPMTGALAKVAALNPVTYNWKVDGSAGQGFIAHELQAVVPDCVTGEKDAVDAEGNPQYQGVDTSFLVATLTAAIKEQQAIIEQQSQMITSLTSTMQSLTSRIEALENK